MSDELEQYGIASSVAEELRKEGYHTADDIRQASDEELDAVPQVGAATIRELRAAIERGPGAGGTTPRMPFGPGDPAVDPSARAEDLSAEDAEMLAAAHLAGGPPYPHMPAGGQQGQVAGMPYFESYEMQQARKNAEQMAKERADRTRQNHGFREQFGDRLFEVMVEQWGGGPVQFHRGDLVPASEFPDELDLVHALNTGTVRLAVEYEGRSIHNTVRPVESQGTQTGALQQVAGPTLDPVRNPHLAGYTIPPGVSPGMGGVAAGSPAEQALWRHRGVSARETPPPPPGR